MKNYLEKGLPRLAYIELRNDYAKLQTRLRELMVAHAEEFACGGYRSYEPLEAEAIVVQHLAFALAALGDRSALEELGIEG